MNANLDICGEIGTNGTKSIRHTNGNVIGFTEEMRFFDHTSGLFHTPTREQLRLP